MDKLTELALALKFAEQHPIQWDAFKAEHERGTIGVAVSSQVPTAAELKAPEPAPETASETATEPTETTTRKPRLKSGSGTT